jgi:hypothetical protein
MCVHDDDDDEHGNDSMFFHFVFFLSACKAAQCTIGVTLSSQNLKTQLHNIIITGEASFVLFQKCAFLFVLGLAYYQEGKDIVLRFIIEYSGFTDFFRPLGNNNNNNNRSIFI